MERQQFQSAEQMFEKIISNVDLYNIKTGEYVFHYNDKDAICYYTLTAEEARKIAKQAAEHSEYWAGYLGPGGWIIDEPKDSIAWCKDRFKDDGWVKADKTFLNNVIEYGKSELKENEFMNENIKIIELCTGMENNIQWALLKRDTQLSPYIAVWNYKKDGKDCSWGQGHYFNEFKDAYIHFANKTENIHDPYVVIKRNSNFDQYGDYVKTLRYPQKEATYFISYTNKIEDALIMTESQMLCHISKRYKPNFEIERKRNCFQDIELKTVLGELNKLNKIQENTKTRKPSQIPAKNEMINKSKEHIR